MEMMTRTAVLFGCLLMAAIGFGQKMDPFDAHVADYRLLISKQVQAEVGITSGQRAGLNSAADHERAVAAPYLQQLQKQGKTENDLATDTKYQGFLLELHDKALGLLSPGQLKRLRELTLQRLDVSGLCDVMVAKRLNMSVPQLTKVRSIFSDAVKRSSTIVNAVERQVLLPYKDMRVKTKAEATALNDRVLKERNEALKKKKPELDQIEKQTKRQLEAVLSTKQLAAYKSLQGKTFNPK